MRGIGIKLAGALAAMAIALSGCGGSQSGNTQSGDEQTGTAQNTGDETHAQAPADGPDDATVKGALEKPWADIGKDDVQTYDYHAIDRADPRQVTMRESVETGIPAGKTVYPVRIAVLRTYNGRKMEVVAHYLFWKDEYGGWTSSSVAATDSKMEDLH